MRSSLVRCVISVEGKTIIISSCAAYRRAGVALADCL